MIGERHPRRVWTAPQEDPRAYAPPPSGLRRFLGGSPGAVLTKLFCLSVLVGAGMALFGVTPDALFWHIYGSLRALFDISLETFHDFGRWILAGAAVVIPLWLISRFMAMGR